MWSFKSRSPFSHGGSVQKIYFRLIPLTYNIDRQSEQIFRSNVFSFEGYFPYTQHTRPNALPGLLKWSAKTSFMSLTLQNKGNIKVRRGRYTVIQHGFLIFRLGVGGINWYSTRSSDWCVDDDCATRHQEKVRLPITLTLYHLKFN